MLAPLMDITYRVCYPEPMSGSTLAALRRNIDLGSLTALSRTAMKRPKKPFRVIPAGKDDAIPEHDPGTKRFIDKVRFLHGFANTVLVAIFTWLQLRELLDGILANSNTRILLWHGGLALYYASWVFGTGFDLKSA